MSHKFAKLSFLVVLLLSLAVLLAACDADAPVVAPAPAVSVAPPVQVTAATPDHYAGWAIDAYPDMTQEQMDAAVLRMKQAGANVIWIAHANPARSYKAAPEVGLNPSVLYAFRDFSLVQHDDAVEIVAAEKRMLQACQNAGVKAVLSVGYQTQMGQEWSKAHPNDLRRDANGKLWQVTNGNDPYASVYSPTFQADMHDYYAWIAYEFLNPYRQTIMMLNLADEPLGGDYSSWADQEFQRRNGYSFAAVGNDAARQTQLGQFQSGVITDFMKLTAGYWQEINPGLPVTMSFDGGAMREDNGLPDLESLFREAPSNFVLTWDMYPRDRGSLNVALNDDDVSRLFMLVRTISGYSARYNRKVWFWSAANSWGLGQGVDQPGTIADAQANLLYLAQLMNQGGGYLEGLAVWNYNIRTQGLYNYSWGSTQQTSTWNPDEMFDRVSAGFETARLLMSEPAGQPDLLFLKPAEWQDQQIGRDKPNYYDPVVDYARLDVLARNNIVNVTASHWPDALPSGWTNLKTVVVLSPAEYLTAADITGLQNWVRAGGSLVAALGVAQRVDPAASSQWSGSPTAEVYGQGRIFVSRQPTYQLFDSTQVAQLQPFWQNLFGLSTYQTGYMVRTASSYMDYQLGQLSRPAAAPSWPTGWQGRSLQRYNSAGVPQLFSQSTWPDWAFERSEFVFGLAKS